MAGTVRDPKPSAVATAIAPPYPEVMTIDQLADYLHLHKQVVYRHVKRGNIPASRIGATIRFKKSLIDAWLEESARRSMHAGEARAAASKPEPKEKFVWE
jgi:excisionase family DNA binding protein